MLLLYNVMHLRVETDFNGYLDCVVCDADGSTAGEWNFCPKGGIFSYCTSSTTSAKVSNLHNCR